MNTTTSSLTQKWNRTTRTTIQYNVTANFLFLKPPPPPLTTKSVVWHLWSSYSMPKSVTSILLTASSFSLRSALVL